MLALHTLRFHDEVVGGDDLELARRRPQARPSARSRWPSKLVESLDEDFDPADYEDTYREAVLDLIKRKATGEEIDLVEQEEPEHGDDLMAALEASLEARALMARALWSGSLSFGLVNVPVQLVSAARDLDYHFHQLHEKDKVRIEQRRFCTKEDVEVAWEEVAHGYDLDGKQVIVTDEELGSVAAAQDAHDRHRGVRRRWPSVDPIYFDHPTSSSRPATARARCAPTACWSR